MRSVHHLVVGICSLATAQCEGGGVTVQAAAYTYLNGSVVILTMTSGNIPVVRATLASRKSWRWAHRAEPWSQILRCCLTTLVFWYARVLNGLDNNQ